MNIIDKFRGSLLGLAVGDAVGTTNEFKARGTFTPLTDMVGGGPFNLKLGEWTDDTSMSLCSASSLIDLQRFDAHDQMQRFCKWMDTGFYSSTGSCFDIGIATRNALMRFKSTGDPFSGSTDPMTAGNGGIMRLAPIPMFFYPNRDMVISMSAESSRMTHAATECIDAARLFGAMMFLALSGTDKETILTGHGLDDIESKNIISIAMGDYMQKDIDDISGSGYVVDSLRAALWCFYTTDSFEDAILRAANLGEDADTTAAICGQISGAFYGVSGIPQRWLEWLVMADEIRHIADQLQEIQP